MQTAGLAEKQGLGVLQTFYIRLLRMRRTQLIGPNNHHIVPRVEPGMQADRAIQKIVLVHRGVIHLDNRKFDSFDKRNFVLSFPRTVNHSPTPQELCDIGFLVNVNRTVLVLLKLKPDELVGVLVFERKLFGHVGHESNPHASIFGRASHRQLQDYDDEAIRSKKKQT